MKNERGVILIVVVWALTLLMVIAAEMAHTMRLEGLTANTYEEEVVTYYLAMAGLHRALYQLAHAQQRGLNMLNQPGALGQKQQQEGELDVWVRGDGRWQSQEFGAGGYWVRVNDEGGKLNLNRMAENGLRQTFTNLGFDANSGEALTDAILDWRDTDPLTRLHGAESDYYLTLPTPYPAKDGPFDILDELLLVRGVTPALFYGGLREVFTVYSGGGESTNLLTAGPLVLQAVLGIDRAAAQDLVQRRAETNSTDLANLLPQGAGGGMNFNLPTVVTIESVGYLNTGGVTRHLSAVVQRTGLNQFRFLRWQDRQEGTVAPPPANPSQVE
jgi:type II secretory pathway component PulK